ncbi:MAG: hypothetical protein EDM05_041825 [Leptolyngbya sp. IPPAS B-1204]|jgi:hypothetical protein|nr:hypothetical protein [Elainella sp. C42_A2020_010]RNJ68329.1 MAG: hypothetical protein EDM05_14500 [Leptolyngbya sp. IPPAS B-1204]
MAQQKQSLQALGSISALETVKRTNLRQQNAMATRTRASNGTLATATLLGDFPGRKRTVKDSVGRGNPNDFFRINVNQTSRIKVNFFNRSDVNLKLALLDSTGKAISANGRRQLTTIGAGKTATTLVRGAAPGTYYLKAQGPTNGNHRYEMNLFVNRSGGPAPLPCGCGV